MGIGRETNKKTHARNAVASGVEEWEAEQDEQVMSRREADRENEADHSNEYDFPSDFDREQTTVRSGRARQNMTFGELEDYCHALREMDWKRSQQT